MNVNYFAGNTKISWKILRRTKRCVRTSTSSKVRVSVHGTVHPYAYVCSLRPCGFSDASKIPVESDTDDEGIPRISLAEMMEDLNLNDATGGEGADMMTD